MRVRLSRSRSTLAAISPTFTLVGASTPNYLPLLSAVRSNFDYFLILRGPASLDNYLAFHRNQAYPPGTNSVPRESLLKKIFCDLMSEALVWTQVLHETT